MSVISNIIISLKIDKVSKKIIEQPYIKTISWNFLRSGG